MQIAFAGFGENVGELRQPAFDAALLRQPGLDEAGVHRRFGADVFAGLS